MESLENTVGVPENFDKRPTKGTAHLRQCES